MLLAAGLTACTAASSTSSTTSTSTGTTTATVAAPSTSPSPSLTREQDAAAAAKAVYDRYQAALALVYGRGGSDAKSVFEKVAAGPELVHLLDQASQIRKLGWKQISGPTTKSIKVQSVRFAEGQLPQVTLRACADARTRRAVDAQGKDVTRKVALPFSDDFVLVTKFEDKGWLVTQYLSSGTKSC
jgi:hypothetical protein